MEIERNDIIQVTREGHKWYGCLLQVSDVKPTINTVVAYLKIPMEDVAYIRLNFEEFEKVGKAVLEYIDPYEQLAQFEDVRE